MERGRLVRANCRTRGRGVRARSCVEVMIDHVLYWVVLALVRFVQTLPLRWAARLGRAGGALAFWLDGRHRRVALENLTRCFASEKSAQEIRALARENFKRIGESYSCGIKTAGMTWPE